MEKFLNVSGVAAPMPLVNIDTDMIKCGTIKMVAKFQILF